VRRLLQNENGEQDNSPRRTRNENRLVTCNALQRGASLTNPKNQAETIRMVNLQCFARNHHHLQKNPIAGRHEEGEVSICGKMEGRVPQLLAPTGTVELSEEKVRTGRGRRASIGGTGAVGRRTYSGNEELMAHTEKKTVRRAEGGESEYCLGKK